MDNTILKQQIIDYLYEHGEVCEAQGNCGRSVINIADKLNLKEEDVKPLMNELYTERKVIYRKTPFSILFFLNYNNYEKMGSNT